MADYPEEQMLADFQAGMPKAFDWIYHNYYRKLYTFSLAFTGNVQESEDIAIKSLQKLFERHKRFDNLPEIGSFLFVMVRNQSFNYLRDLKTREQKIKAIAAVTEQVSHAHDVPDPPVGIGKYILQLPNRSQQVIKMLYFEDMSYQQVAERMQIAKATVCNLRMKGLDTLRGIVFHKNLFLQVGILLFLAFCRL